MSDSWVIDARNNTAAFNTKFGSSIVLPAYEYANLNSEIKAINTKDPNYHTYNTVYYTGIREGEVSLYDLQSGFR